MVPPPSNNVRDGALFGFLLLFSRGDIAVITVVPDHLPPSVRDMRAHDRQPLQGFEDLTVFTALRCSIWPKEF
jgi:hypothetical protein